jgi:hypothetical protein
LTFPPKNPPAVEPVHNPKNTRAKSLLINEQPINTDNSFIPNQINLTTKNPTNLPNPTDLSSQNPNQNLTPKTLPVTNMARKAIPLDYVRLIQNYMNYI